MKKNHSGRLNFWRQIKNSLIRLAFSTTAEALPVYYQLCTA